MTNKIKKRKAKLQPPIDLDLPPRTYQPSRAELNEEIDMPALSLNKARKLFARPIEQT